VTFIRDFSISCTCLYPQHHHSRSLHTLLRSKLDLTLGRKSGTLLSLHNLNSVNDRRVPHLGHLLVTSLARVNTVTQLRGGESSVLVNDPNWRLGGVLGCCPRGDGLVERLDGSV